MEKDLRILILGGTGFLGRNLVKYLLGQEPKPHICVTGHSEYKIAFFQKLFPEIDPPTVMDVSNPTAVYQIEKLLQEHRINAVIHTAAMKHVGICQNNIMTAIYTNVLFTNSLVDLCKTMGIPRLIALSTDKANAPKNVYGMTKYLMGELVLQKGYQLYQGVNFLWSDGSVLDIWTSQHRQKQPLTYTKLQSERYYCPIEDVCADIIDGLSSKEDILYTRKMYRISLQTLLDAFCLVFPGVERKQIGFPTFEKDIETLGLEDVELDIIQPSVKEVTEILKEVWKHTLLSP